MVSESAAELVAEGLNCSVLPFNLILSDFSNVDVSDVDVDVVLSIREIRFNFTSFSVT